MPYIDIAIFIGFFLVNLIVGIKYRGQSQSFKEYAIGDKKFSTATLTATLVATWASGSMFFNDLEQTYSSGLYYILANTVGGTFALIITGFILGPRLAPFLNHVSMADAMSSIYGKGVQVIAAISSLLLTIGYIAIQFKVIAKILSGIFNYQGSEIGGIFKIFSKILPGYFGHQGLELGIIAAIIIIVYSAFGGVRSVTFTDVIQFITFGTLLPVLALVIWQNIQDPNQVINTLATNPNFDLKQVVKWDSRFVGTLTLAAYYITPGLPPQLFQRIAMARDITQVKKSFLYSTGLLLLIHLFMFWIAILLLADNPNLNTNQVVTYMIEKHTYTGLKGFLGIGIFALAMSTADSSLNACSVLVTNDILLPLKITKQASVSTAAISTFIIGFLALILALSIQNILQILLISANFYIPILTAPMLLTIFGFRTTKKTIFIGMGAGFLITFFLLFYFKNVNSMFPGMLTNLVFLLGSHYLLREPGGWMKSPATNKLLDINQVYSVSWKERWHKIKNIQLWTYLEKNLPNEGYYYPLLAFYLLTATYVSLYNLPCSAEKEYFLTCRFIQYSVLVISTSLLAYPIWPLPLKKKRLLACLWPAIMFYTLFFVGGILVILSGFQANQILIFMLNVVMTVLLAYWPLALTLAFIGISAAILLFEVIWGVPVIATIPKAFTFQLSYGLLLFSSFLIALFRHKQAHANLAARQQLLEKVNRETNSRLLEALQYREEFLQELKPDEIALFDNTTAAYINHVIYRVKNYLRLDVSQISLQQLLEQITDLLKIQKFHPFPKIYKQTEQQYLQADINRIKQLILNSLHYLRKYKQKENPIIIAIEDATLGYEVSYMQDYIKKVSALKITITVEPEIPTTKALYWVVPDQPVMQLPQSEEELALAENDRIIDAHYGYIDLDEGYTHVYVIPVNVREIRGKVMELLREPVAPDPEEIKHPLAIELEQQLFDRLSGTQIDPESIHTALSLIKKYHSGVKRKSGEPFFTHPMSVALILLDYTTDQAAMLAALLHDTVEDTSLTLAQLEATFGKDVAFLVRKATKLEEQVKRINLAEHEYIQRLTYYEDKRAALIKLADRLHNMRTLGSMPSDKQRRIARETLTFFVPMANHLQLNDMRQELEKLSLSILGEQAKEK